MDPTEIRTFNRYYAILLGVFEGKLFASPYSITELRVIGEIGRHQGVKAHTIAKFLQMDRSYLSRIIKKFEKHDLLVRKPDAADQRVWQLELTEKGNALYQEIEIKSDQKILTLLANLQPDEIAELHAAMKTIQTILTKVVPNEMEDL